MTIEKAIEQLEDLIKEAESHMTGNKIDDEIPIDDKTALEMAIQALDEITIQALEKQVPKKIIWKYDTFWACCPNCGYDNYDMEKEESNFCPDCGQALDWSDNDE